MAKSWNDLFDSFIKSAQRTEKAADRAARETTDLADSLDNLGDSAEVAHSHTNGTIDFLKNLRTACTNLNIVGSKLVEYTIGYQTAARRAVRGTMQLSTSTEALSASYWNNVVSGNEFAKAAGVTAEEGVRMSNALESAARQASINTLGYTEEIRKHMSKAAEFGVYAGMSIEESTKLGVMAVKELNMSFADSSKLFSDAGAAAETFGLAGSKSFEALADQVSRIQALDRKDRLAYARKVVRSAGLQEKAAVEFGKYTTSLTKSKGTESIRNAALLSATSGMDMDTLLRAMANPADADAQQTIMQAQLQATRAIAPGFEELNKRLATGQGRDGDGVEFKVQEQLADMVAKWTGLSSDLIGETQDRLNSLGKARQDPATSAAAFDASANRLDASGVTAAAQQLLDNNEKLLQHAAKKAEAIGVQLRGTDKVIDIEQSIKRWADTGDEVMNLGHAAGSAAAALWAMATGTAVKGLLGTGLGGKAMQAATGGASKIASRIAGLFGAAEATAATATAATATGGATAAGGGGLAAASMLSKTAKGVGVAGLALEAAMTAYKMSTVEGRQAMSDEIEMSAARSNTLEGTARNFGAALISPTESLAKMGMMAVKVKESFADLADTEARAEAAKKKGEAQSKDLWSQAMKGADGKLLKTATDRATQLLETRANELGATDRDGKNTNFATPSALAAMVAQGMKDGADERDVMGQVHDMNRRALEARAAGDQETVKAVQAQFKAMEALYEKVKFSGGTFDTPKTSQNAVPRAEVPAPAEKPDTGTQARVPNADVLVVAKQMLAQMTQMTSYLQDLLSKFDVGGVRPAV